MRYKFISGLHRNTMQSSSVMELSEIGKVAYNNWTLIPEHYRFVKLDEFVVMPDHIHGIIIIDNDQPRIHPRRNDRSNVPTIPPPSPDSLSVIIREYKGSVTRYFRKLDMIEDIWQSRFYDRIIRNNIEMENVRRYIQNNVAKYQETINSAI